MKLKTTLIAVSVALSLAACSRDPDPGPQQAAAPQPVVIQQAPQEPAPAGTAGQRGPGLHRGFRGSRIRWKRPLAGLSGIPCMSRER